MLHISLSRLYLVSGKAPPYIPELNGSLYSEVGVKYDCQAKGQQGLDKLGGPAEERNAVQALKLSYKLHIERKRST
jgi:hypothetical protein